MTHVDVGFPVRKPVQVARDHGYALYGALSRLHPLLHGADWLGVHPLAGALDDTTDTLTLRDGAELRLRLPTQHIADVLALSGRTLKVQDSSLTLGVPRVHQLAPAATLDARLVFIKLTQPPRSHNAELGRDTLDNEGFQQRYSKEIERQLAAMEVVAPFQLTGKRTLTVAGRRLVGFSVRVGELDVDASLRLQERGLGGKRTMGCGLFRPTRWTVS